MQKKGTLKKEQQYIAQKKKYVPVNQMVFPVSCRVPVIIISIITGIRNRNEFIGITPEATSAEIRYML